MKKSIPLLLSILFISACLVKYSLADDNCPEVCQRCDTKNCYIHFSSITKDFFYNNNTFGLVIISSNIGHTINSKITINITTSTFIATGSSFYGMNIYISATNQMELENTIISTSGAVLSGPRTPNNTGCAFAGRGGYCGGESDSTLMDLDPKNFGYGTFDMDFTDNTPIGSGGTCSKYTGGGKIVIKADLLFLSQRTSITADGFPSLTEHCSISCPKPLNSSGAGGYIYISANYITMNDQNDIVISVNGGGLGNNLGCGN